MSDAPPSAVSLESYCVSKSVSDRRVELLGAFFSGEKAANRMFDMADNYESRYVAFATQPA